MPQLRRIGFFALAFVFACSAADPAAKKRTAPATTDDPSDPGDSTDPTVPSDGTGNNGSSGANSSGGNVNTATAKLATNIHIAEVAVMQTVKIPLTKAGTRGALAAAPDNVTIVTGRPALARIYVATESKWSAHAITAELTIKNKADKTAKTLTASLTPRTTSTDASLTSTFNFELTGSELAPGATFSARLLDDAADAVPTSNKSASQYPGDGTMAPLLVAKGQTLKVTLVPVRYDFDRSKRLPDTSATAIAAYKKRMQQLYPVADVTVTVRAAFPWTHEIGPDGTGWAEVLDAVTQLRGDDSASDDNYYFGIFDPASSDRTYCSAGCVLGLSGLVNTTRDSYMRASVGVGYIDPEGTMAHEIGHAHGRRHADCGGAQGVDGSFPYTKGSIGVWGYDAPTKTLFDPSVGKDVMGYCQNVWISDYTYKALFDRVEEVYAPTLVSLQPRRFRTVLDNGKTLVAHKTAETRRIMLGGEERSVDVLDEAGVSVGSTRAHFYPFDHLPGGIYLVEEPEGAYRSMNIAGAAHAVTVQ